MRGFARLISVSLVVLAGCSTEQTAPSAPPAPPGLAVETTTPPAPAPPAPGAADESRTPPAAGHEGRDPFVPSVTAPEAPPPVADVRLRKSKRFAVDDLKLVGIVNGVETPRAMLVDPRGKGWVVTRGQLVGRPEVLHDSAGDHSVSWRVDRIRESDVILVREDAAHSVAVPSSTRVLALRHDPIVSDDAELDD